MWTVALVAPEMLLPRAAAPAHRQPRQVFEARPATIRRLVAIGAELTHEQVPEQGVTQDRVPVRLPDPSHHAPRARG